MFEQITAEWDRQLLYDEGKERQLCEEDWYLVLTT